MKGPSRSELSLDDSNLEWIEQHHRTTSSRKAPTTQKSLGQNLSQNQQSAQHDFVHSGDESDYAEKQRQSIFYPPDPHKRTKEYHIEQAIGAIKLLKAASKPEGWKKVFRHKSDCVVSQSTGNGDKHPAFKGEHVIRGFRAQDVFSIVGVRKLWDDWYDQLNCVESYDEATNLMYMVMKGNMSSKTRDISMVERIEVERDGTIYFASCSVESNKIPLMSGKVRADIFVAGWIIQPLPSNPPITKVTYVIQTDLLSRLPKFIARRALAKRPLVIATIETHLKKNGVPMVMTNLVSQTTNRHRSLSEPLKPEKFLFAERDSEENVQSGSSFLSPIEPIRPDNHVEELNTKEDSDEEDLQLAMASVSESSTARNSLAPSLLSTRSHAPSIFSPEFLENNALLGDTALFGDSVLFGKGGIYENTMRQQDEISRDSSDTSRTHSPQLTQALAQVPDRTRRAPPQAARTLPPDNDARDRHQLASHVSTRRMETPRSNPTSRTAHPSTPVQPVTPTVTLATPPLTPTTSIDGKDTTSDSDASLTPKVKIVPRAPKTHTSVDTSLPQRPSSMAFAAYGMRSPSAIMEARRHSTLISRSSSFAPRHSHAVPIRGSPSISLQGMNRSSMIFNSTPNALKRHSTAPSLDSNRSSTLGFAPVLVLPHRHSETARKALAMFKVLASSPEDRWKAVSSDGTFKSYSRVISGAGLPMLRAEGVISGGWTVEQINAVIESSGCRQIWDERFDNLSIAETFNSNEYLFHVALQGIGSLTGRDLAGVTIVDRDPQTAALCNVSTSVLDSTIPEDPGRIRALLELSGWSLRPTFDGQGNTVSVNVTFVIQIDIRGTLPISVVKSLTASMMTAVFRLNQFINKTGYPPYASHISGTRLLDTFDPKSGFYELCYKAAPGWTEVRVGRKVYKDGYDFFIKPDDPTVRVELAPDFGGVRIWTTLDHEGQSIIAQVTRKGQNPTGDSTQEPSQLSAPEDSERESESDGSSRRKRESYVPRRPRDSRVFESSSPTFGGPFPRKASHLKSNDDEDFVELESPEQVDDRSTGDVGGGSDLRPHEAAVSSIGRKRRSASFTTLSAYDPNLAVASSSYRPAELLQASKDPKASQESERTGRSRSRSRTPRSMTNLSDGGPSPILPRRSSSLSRYSVPLSPPFLSPEQAPPMPIVSSFTAVPLIQGSSPEPSNTALADSPTYTSPGSTRITSPFSSPTLGPFHIPHQPIETLLPSRDASRTLEDPQALDLPASDIGLETKDMKASETQPDPETPTKLVSVLKKTILQPAAEIPTSSHAADSDVDASKLIIRANIPSISEILAESSSVDSGSIDKGSKGSLAAMRSPLTSPIPAPRSSSLNHRSSNTSIGSNHSRRVTFSPDVIDNSETRSTPLRPKRLSKKKSIPLKASPLSESQDLASTNASAAESVKGAEPATPVPVAVVSSDLEITSTAEAQVESGDESDEAEFVEAQSEPFDDTPEDSLATAAVEAIVNVEASAQRETEKEQMLLDMKGYYRGHEELWRTAIDSYVSEMNMVQVKAVLVFVLFAVYACGIISVI